MDCGTCQALYHQHKGCRLEAVTTTLAYHQNVSQQRHAQGLSIRGASCVSSATERGTLGKQGMVSEENLVERGMCMSADIGH